MDGSSCLDSCRLNLAASLQRMGMVRDLAATITCMQLTRSMELPQAYRRAIDLDGVRIHPADRRRRGVSRYKGVEHRSGQLSRPRPEDDGAALAKAEFRGIPASRHG